MQLHCLVGQVAVQIHSGGQIGQLGESESDNDRDHYLHSLNS